jgi:hypothetical protein
MLPKPKLEPGSMAEPPRRFPSPWRADPIPGAYVIRAANGQALYIYSSDNEDEARQAKVLTKDEARRIAVNIARLPGSAREGFAGLKPYPQTACSEDPSVGPLPSPSFSTAGRRPVSRWTRGRCRYFWFSTQSDGVMASTRIASLVHHTCSVSQYGQYERFRTWGSVSMVVSTWMPVEKFLPVARHLTSKTPIL